MNQNDRLTRLEVVKLIALRDFRDGDNTQGAENRVSHKLGYAVKNGVIKQEKDGSFTLENLSFWVNKNWPGKFNDFPVIGCIHNSLPMFIKNMSGFTSDSMPNSIEKCHSLLEVVYQRIATLEKENSGLKPDAERYRANCKTNKVSAEKKRGKI